MCFSLPIQTLLFHYITCPPKHRPLNLCKPIYAQQNLREEGKGLVSKEKGTEMA